MGSQTAGQFPDTFDRGELRTVRREEQEGEEFAILVEPGAQELGVVVAGVVEEDDHLLVPRPVPKQLGEVNLEGGGIERCGEPPDERATA